MLVFTVSVLAGAMLAGAGLAGGQGRPDGAGGTARSDPHPAGPAGAAQAGPAARPTADLTLARSLVFSGAGALTLSLAGLAMIGRRRRRW